MQKTETSIDLMVALQQQQLHFVNDFNYTMSGLDIV